MIGRVLCLVLDSDPIESWEATYETHRRYWRRCFTDFQWWVDGWFLRAHPALEKDFTVDLALRTFTARGPESLGTIFDKIQVALRVLLEKDHVYVVRTGLSSLYDFPLLRKEPVRAGVYAGHLVEGQYVSGGGVLLSDDAARLVAAPTDMRHSEWDDIAIAEVLRERGIQPEHREMFVYDYTKGPEQLTALPNDKYLCYRLRDYDDPRREKEREAIRACFARLYGRK